MEESVDMKPRQSLVQNISKTGRKPLVNIMDEEVRNNVFCLYA